VTYEKFFANWGHVSGNPYIDRISAMPKYVASRSLAETAWNAHPARGLIQPARSARLKEQPGKDPHQIRHQPLRQHPPARPPDRRVSASGSWPVVAGSGQRLFEDVDTSGLNLRLNR